MTEEPGLFTEEGEGQIKQVQKTHLCVLFFGQNWDKKAHYINGINKVCTQKIQYKKFLPISGQ